MYIALYIPFLLINVCHCNKEQIVCDLIWDLYPTFAPTADPHGYFFTVSHPYLDTRKGYLPNVTYQVELTSGDLKSFYDYTVAAFDAQDSKKLVGALIDTSQESNTIDCKHDGQSVVSNSLKENVVSLDKVVLSWKAPATVASSCVLFAAQISRPNSFSIYDESPFCPNAGKYRRIFGHQGNINVQELFETSFWLSVEVPDDHHIRFQIDSFYALGGLNDTVSLLSFAPGKPETQFEPLTVFSSDSINTTGRIGELYSTSSSFTLFYVRVAVGAIINTTILYYSIPADQGCNRTIENEQSGVLTSPNYPDAYFPGLRCFYNITVDSDKRILIQILAFHTVASLIDTNVSDSGSLLSGDFLQFTHGVTWDSRKLWYGVMDNETIASESNILQTESNTLQFRFITDLQQKSSGFFLFWRTLSSCKDSVLQSNEGTITSVNYPHNYLNDQLCTYIIRVEKGYIVHVYFEEFHLEPLNVYTEDCVGLDYVSIGRQKRCGSWVGLENLLKFYSESNHLNVTFYSNSKINGPGFKAHFKAVQANGTDDCPTNMWNHEAICYEVNMNEVEWLQALHTCKMRGGVLAMVQDESTSTFINSVLKHTSTVGQAFWVGASDLQYETDFTWVDGSRANFTNWFPGWEQFSLYNRQPNDDGLSEQDCLELRRNFLYPSKGEGSADKFYWSDRNCAAENAFLCQYTRPGHSVLRGRSDILCNGSVALNNKAWYASMYSPLYPHHYPDFVDCYIIAHVPPKTSSVITFSRFILEEHESCDYDYLEMWEEDFVNGTWNIVKEVIRVCGDWSRKLKLLRRESISSRIILHLHTDHSRGFSGFMANIKLTKQALANNSCNNMKLVPFEKSCYLIVNYPKVQWATAEKNCVEAQGDLVSIETTEEDDFISKLLIEGLEFNVEDSFWIGASGWPNNITWSQGTEFSFSNWMEGADLSSSNKFCALIQQLVLSKDLSPQVSDRHFWNLYNCTKLAGYICELPKPKSMDGTSESVTYKSSGEFNITLPTYPEQYPNKFNYSIHIISPEFSRILITFSMIDIEFQDDCLYDFIEIRTKIADDAERYCGTKASVEFASYTNEAHISFRSDHSITGKGFIISWQAINISGCKVNLHLSKTHPLTNLTSVNYPNQYLNALDCQAHIKSENGTRVALNFLYFDVGEADEQNCIQTDHVTLYLRGELSNNNKKLCGPLNLENKTTDLMFVSYANEFLLSFYSDAHLRRDGYLSQFRIVHNDYYEQSIFVTVNDTVNVRSPNYPMAIPSGLCFTLMYRTFYGYRIQLLFDELFLDPVFTEHDNGTDALTLDENSQKINGVKKNFSMISRWNRILIKSCSGLSAKNKLWRRFAASLTVVEDLLFWSNRTIGNLTGIIESCTPNPCYNGGTCSSDVDNIPSCTCPVSYLGVFCHKSQCDFQPCEYGKCVLSDVESRQFVCECELGYTGENCQLQIHPCASNPCRNGHCMESIGTFTCRCLEGYKGEYCEKVDLFDAQTLRESFFRDPFWLGLFMVLGVMALVGLVSSWRKRTSEYSISPNICCTGKEVDSEEEDEHGIKFARPIVHTGPPQLIEDEDGEVYFSLLDLGIDSSHYSSLNLGPNVSFKMKLSELSHDQMNSLEHYLEQILKIYQYDAQSSEEVMCMEEYDGHGHSEAEDDAEGDGEVTDKLLLAPINRCRARSTHSNPLTMTSSKGSVIRSSSTVHDDIEDENRQCLNNAFDSITDLILKSAEVVTPEERAAVVHCFDNRTLVVPTSDTAVRKRKDWKSSRLAFKGSLEEGGSRLFGAASRAIRFVKRPSGNTIVDHSNLREIPESALSSSLSWEVSVSSPKKRDSYV